MGLKQKLIRWGWIDEQGSSLTWRELQQKPHRVPVAYLRNDKGKPTPLFNVLDGQFNRRPPKQYRVMRSVELGINQLRTA